MTVAVWILPLPGAYVRVRVSSHVSRITGKVVDAGHVPDLGSDRHMIVFGFCFALGRGVHCIECPSSFDLVLNYYNYYYYL